MIVGKKYTNKNTGAFCECVYVSPEEDSTGADKFRRLAVMRSVIDSRTEISYFKEGTETAHFAEYWDQWIPYEVSNTTVHIYYSPKLNIMTYAHYRALDIAPMIYVGAIELEYDSARKLLSVQKL